MKYVSDRFMLCGSLFFENRGEIMTRREIRENIFKLVFCGEFHTSDELQGQVDAYFEALPEATEEERAIYDAEIQRHQGPYHGD